VANDTRYYYDYHFPLPLVQATLRLLGLIQDKDPSGTLPTDANNREWFSQPRAGTSAQTECVTVTFRLPLSVSEISTEILRMPNNAELWYQDRSNNWRPVLDPQLAPLKVRVDRSDAKSWYRWSTKCYPIVAKKVQVRMTRYDDGVLTNIPYPVGLRNTLIRRNVYDRQAGGAFEEEVDVMGNVVSKYVRDWDAAQATDDNYTTFWKSQPQPDPAAVVSLYLDVRSDAGGPQVIDKVFLDPVYSGQHLNLYYSSDDLVGTRNLSPITLVPSDNGGVLNTAWRPDKGLTDTSTGTGSAYYRWPLSIGPQEAQEGWIGVEWKPSFLPLDITSLKGAYDNGADYNPGDIVSYNGRYYTRLLGANPGYPPGTTYWGPALDLPAQNPDLYEAMDATGTTRKPKLSYDVGDNSFRLDFTNTAAGAIRLPAVYASTPWVAGDTLRVIAGWAYDPKRAYIKVVNQNGVVIAEDGGEDASIPDLVTFSGTSQVSNFRGTISNLIVKLEDYDPASESFLANPTFYCDPDPVLPDSNGRYPSTTLDNAIYAAPFVSREHGTGGSDRSSFEDKEWTPIWRNYVAVKGMLHLPQPISMKFLKLEFTNLTEQPYPIYESGIEVAYKVFPISVTQSSSIGPRLYTGQGGFLGLGTFISMNGVRSVNFLDPNSVLKAIGGMLGTQIPPVVISTGTPYLTDTLPNQGMMAVENSRRIEAASSYVYSRDTIAPYVLSQDKYNTLIKAEGLQAIQPYVDVPWSEIEAANPGAVTKVRSTGTVPIRGTDWWIYPGQQLKVPASVMNRLTATQTVTERKLTLESRTRFNTTSVHKYETRTVRRDAAVAYFAAVREVQPYISTYITGEDVAVYDFPSYTSQHWAGIGTSVSPTPAGAMTATYPSAYGVLTSQEMTSQSDFTKVTLDFQDSGTVRSNSMWVDIDQTNDNVADTDLSPFFRKLPEGIGSGTWLDSQATWMDPIVEWGSSYALVTVNVDDDRLYEKRRVVHLTRNAGSGEGGIAVDQWENISPGAQFRVGAVFLRPVSNPNNQIKMRLIRNDGFLLLEQTLAGVPKGRWYEATTEFAEVPETLENASFDSGLTGWIPSGGPWTAVTNMGRTGTKSAKLVTNGATSTLTTQKMDIVNGTTVSASAWVRWSGITPGSPIRLNALLYNNAGGLISTVPLQNQVTPTTATQTGWSLVSGSTLPPDNTGVTQVAFQILVPAGAGTGGTVWVDDFSTSVPGSPRQQYRVELTIDGTDEEELYISDLYTEIAGVRYFVRLGAPGADLIEVTDLRYTKGMAIVTSTEPVKQMQVQTVITNQRSFAWGCKITPNYLR
jgi:hypothetical protein